MTLTYAAFSTSLHACRSWALILYRTHVPARFLEKGVTLDVGTPVHYFASVYVDGQLVGRMERSSLTNQLTLAALPGEGGWM